MVFIPKTVKEMAQQITANSRQHRFTATDRQLNLTSGVSSFAVNRLGSRQPTLFTWPLSKHVLSVLKHFLFVILATKKRT